MTTDEPQHPAYRAVMGELLAMELRMDHYRVPGGARLTDALASVMNVHTPRHYQDVALSIDSWSCEDCFHRRDGYPCPTVREIMDGMGVSV